MINKEELIASLRMERDEAIREHNALPFNEQYPEALQLQVRQINNHIAELEIHCPGVKIS